MILVVGKACVIVMETPFVISTKQYLSFCYNKYDEKTVTRDYSP